MLMPPVPETTTPPPQPTVVCIDDDPLVLQFYRQFLEPHGYRVLTAAEGLLGIDLARRDRPDVILLDVMLRGLSGYDVCRKVRADPTLRSIPIILLTVWDNPNVGPTGRAAGADLTLSKPADAQTLLAAMDRVWRATPVLADPSDAQGGDRSVRGTWPVHRHER
jgi:DNA-binding response OmpR family regulator